jgi:translation initiation factor IF-3
VIEEHDFNVKLNKAIKFLEEGHKVFAKLKYRGREMQHTELGRNVLNRFRDAVALYGEPESAVKMEGNTCSILFVPTKGAKKPKPEKPVVVNPDKK